MTIGHVLWVIVIPAFAGEAESRMMEMVARRLRPKLAFRMVASTLDVMVHSL
jgi:hypothetical protein